MPDAPDIVLCSKVCRHNPTDPKNKKEAKGQKDPHPTEKSFPGHLKKGRLVRTPASLKSFWRQSLQQHSYFSAKQTFQ